MSKCDIHSFLMRFVVDSLRNPNICLANLSIFHLFSVPVLIEPLSFLSFGEGWKQKCIIFFSTNTILYYVPIHSLAAVLITSLPFSVTCCELDTDSVVLGQGYVVLIMWELISNSATKYLKQRRIINAIIVLCGHANKSKS
jgi:hypothetical protein